MCVFNAIYRPALSRHCLRVPAPEVLKYSKLFKAFSSNNSKGTGIRGLIRGMATLPQGNQELLVVRDKVGRPQLSLG